LTFSSPGYTYEWADAENNCLKRNDPDGGFAYIPADEDNGDYAWFLSSGAEAAPYVAPPEPEPETTEQKVDHLLEDYGLTREEMRAALDAKDDE
jgi:hypothetical protein